MKFLMKPILVIILLLSSSLVFADDCFDWFKRLNLKSDSNCLSSCLTAEIGMGTFSCTRRCKEFCKSPTIDRNPSKQEVVNYITRQCIKKDLPAQIGLTIGWMENKFVQFKNNTPVGNRNRDKKGKLISSDWGIMQINDLAWKNSYDLNKIKNDWKYNVDAGIDIAKKSHNAASLKDRNGSNEGNKGPHSYDDNLAQATYSGYNAGVANINRYRIKQDERDKIFLDTYKTSPWRE